MTKKNHSLIFVSCIPFLLFFLKGKIFFPIEKFSSYPNSKNYQHWYKKERKQSIPIKIEERQRNLKYADEKDVFFYKNTYLNIAHPPIISYNFSTLPDNNEIVANQNCHRALGPMCLFHPTLPLRQMYLWKIGIFPKQKKHKKIPTIVLNKNRGNQKEKCYANYEFISCTAQKKWQQFIFSTSKKIWLKPIWKITEKREVLLRNSLYWTKRFVKYWQTYKGKKNQISFQGYPRKFRLSRYSKSRELEITVINSLFLFSLNSIENNRFLQDVKPWRIRLPFSKIWYIPRIERQTFQTHTQINNHQYSYPRITNAERFTQGQSFHSLPIRWVPISTKNRYTREPILFFQKRIRTEKPRFIREAWWKKHNNRHWQSFPSRLLYKSPSNNIQPAEWVIGRCHPWKSSYQCSLKSKLDSYFSRFLGQKWKKRKTCLFSSINNVDHKNSKFYAKNNRFHFQISINLNFFSYTIPTYYSKNNYFLYHQKDPCWGHWINLNIPVLSKARANWLKANNQRNPEDFQGHRDTYWSSVIRPIITTSPNSLTENCLPCPYVTTFFQEEEKKYSIDKKKSNSLLEQVFSSSSYKVNIDQRVFSLIWRKTIQKILLFEEYYVWYQKDIQSMIFLPITICLILRFTHFLTVRFNSVKQDFAFALYRLVSRGGRTSIASTWIEWIRDLIGLSRKNAGINFYTANDGLPQALVERIASCSQDKLLLLDILLYLRKYKFKFFFDINIKIFLTQNRTAEFWFGGFRPAPLLIVGAPGTGKTSLVQLLSNEVGVPIIYQCLTSFTNTAGNFRRRPIIAPQAVQQGFREARSRVPAIFFLDEIDALGINRTNLFANKIKFIGSNFHKRIEVDEQLKRFFIPHSKITRLNSDNARTNNQVLGLGQLLVEIDRGMNNDGLVLIRATNRPQVLDSALTRPGRFNKVIVFPFPNKKKRESILKLSMERFLHKDFSVRKNENLTRWIHQTKGKRPVYIITLRNLAFLHQIVQGITSFDERRKVAWKRIEVNTQNEVYTKKFFNYQNKGVYFRRDIKNFLELEYMERRKVYCRKRKIEKLRRKNFFAPGKKLFFHVAHKKTTKRNFHYCVFIIQNRITLLKENNTLLKKQSQNLFVKKYVDRVSLKTQDHSCIQEIPHLFYSFISVSNYINSLTVETTPIKDWHRRWYNFEIPELIGFHRFGWIPPEENLLQKILKIASKDIRSLEIYQDRLTHNTRSPQNLFIFHLLRRKIDITFAQKVLKIKETIT
jgi:adenylate kinase family enzyme